MALGFGWAPPALRGFLLLSADACPCARVITPPCTRVRTRQSRARRSSTLGVPIRMEGSTAQPPGPALVPSARRSHQRAPLPVAASRNAAPALRFAASLSCHSLAHLQKTEPHATTACRPLIHAAPTQQPRTGISHRSITLQRSRVTPVNAPLQQPQQRRRAGPACSSAATAAAPPQPPPWPGGRPGPAAPATQPENGMYTRRIMHLVKAQ